MMIILGLAVPSLTGVLANRRLQHTLDDFGEVVRVARQHSLAEHRSYLVIQDGTKLVVRPEMFLKGETPGNTFEYQVPRGASVKFGFPAALTGEQPAEWIFWPTGTYESAIVDFAGGDGSWTAKYSTLGTPPQLLNYAPR
jgi:hypothetical protein